MARTRSSFRIGPISIFSLVIILCLAVLSVLTVTTAHATYALASKQALFNTDTYQNEAAAQEFLADLDSALAPVRATNGGSAAALAAVDKMLPANATRENTMVRAEFSTESGRKLNIELTIRSNATYEIASWKATTLWTNDNANQSIWLGAA